MSYIYVITRNEQILGVSAKKYGISIWARDKTDEEKADVVVTRYRDEFSTYSTRGPIRFTLEEYLENPNKQFK